MMTQTRLYNHRMIEKQNSRKKTSNRFRCEFRQTRNDYLIRSPKTLFFSIFRISYPKSV